MADTKTILAQFHEVAANPQKQFQSYLKAGKKVVGSATYYIPEEIIHSMGFVPFGVWGADIQLQKAMEYFAPFYCSIAQSIMELGIKGTFKGMSAIVIPPICDTLRGLGENWKYAPNAKDIPFISMVYPQNRKIDAGKAFTRAGFDRVIEGLKKHCGGVLNEAALEKSIAVYNGHNKAMRDLSAVLADHPSVSPSQRSDVFKSAWFMLKEEHTARVLQLLDALKAEKDGGAKKKRIITTGILADAKSLLAILDAQGFQVVADDIAAESRQYRSDAVEGKDGLDKLVNKFASTDNETLLYDPDKKRAQFMVDLAKQRKADGIVVIMTKFCDPEEFDYPIIKKAFEKAGIPSTVIEVDRQMDNYEQAKTNLQAFAEML
jgi:bcr-type benzoyl-CoA reductase subunit C